MDEHKHDWAIFPVDEVWPEQFDEPVVICRVCGEVEGYDD